MYKFLRTILFLLPPETAHYLSMDLLKLLCSIGLIRKALTRLFKTRSNPVSSFGLIFKNNVGLGAGFDKNAKYLRELQALGFGFVEIGTVTPRPQKGNDKPRLFRLTEDEALINRMGFNNDGVQKIAARLKKWRLSPYSHQLSTVNGQFLIGGNIGKNKTTINEDAWKDYEICFRALHSHVDFFVVNVSSPNTPDLRKLQEKDSLKKILTHLQDINAKLEQMKPILLKIAPDLSYVQINDVVDLAKEINLDGIVATNTTIERSDLKTPESELSRIGNGGLSGKPLIKKATEIVQYIHQKTNGSIPIIASGGIFTSNDARDKLEAGAVLVEVWTGFIYEGPFIVRNLCKDL